MIWWGYEAFSGGVLQGGGGGEMGYWNLLKGRGRRQNVPLTGAQCTKSQILWLMAGAKKRMSTLSIIALTV